MSTSTSAIQTLRKLINNLGFTEEEKEALRKYFIGYEKRQNDALTFLPDYTTIEAKLVFFRSLISTPEQPAVAGKRSASPSGEQSKSKKRNFIDPKFKNICDLVKHIQNSSPSIFTQHNIIKHPQDQMLAVIGKPALYVRESYEDLYRIITKNASKGFEHKFLITGTAGIGKSCFLIYILIRLLCELKSVRIIFQSDKLFYCFESSFLDINLSHGSYEDFMDYLYSSETWYLVDGILNPKIVSAKTVVALSLKGVASEEFQKFDKELVKIYNMPPWSLDELKLCQQHVFTNVSEEIMLDLYKKAGGVPRYIFKRTGRSLQYDGSDKSDESETQKDVVEKESLVRIEKALKEVENFDKLVSCFSENSYFIKYSSRLVHRWPNDYSYKTYHLRWASRYVYEEIEKKLKKQSWKDLLEKMQMLENYPSARGIMFEMYVIHLFQSSINSFDMRELLKDQGSPQQKKFSIEELPTIGNIRTADEISQYKDDGILILPDISNFGAADLLYTPDMIFQVTVSENHPIKQVELVKIVENMPAYEKNNPISLVFVVPDDIYDNFKYQDIVTKDPTSKTFRKVKILSHTLKRIQQWVLKVNISEPPMLAKTGETLRSDFSVGQYNSQPVPSQAEFKASDFKESNYKAGSSTTSSSKVKSNSLGATKTKSKSRETLGSDFNLEESNYKSELSTTFSSKVGSNSLGVTKTKSKSRETLESSTTSSSKVESDSLGAATKSKSRSGDVPLLESEVNPPTIPDSEFSSKKPSKQKRKKNKKKKK